MKKFSSFLSIVLTLAVVFSNFSLPVFAYEKSSVNLKQVKTLSDISGTILNKINSISKSTNALSQDLSINKKGSTTLEKSQQIEVKKDYVEGEILVKYKNTKINLNTTSGRATALNFIKSKSLEKKEDLVKNNISVLRIKDAKTVEQKITELKNDPNVEYVEPNYKRYPAVLNTTDTNKGNLWGLDNTGQLVNGVSGINNADINAPEAWGINEGTNSSIIVAVIDSGVAYNHPDLTANMWDGTNCKDENGIAIAGGCNHGYDYEDGDNTPLPTTSSHGTHIAGTIAAEKNNGLGIIGVAPQAKIMAIKYGNDIASEIKAIDFAIQNGAKIINASFGAATFSQSELDAINHFKTSGGIFVAAAGNGGTDQISDNNELNHFYPSDYNLDNIISVAATDQNDTLATFSNYGATSVDVGAPGTNIYSTVADTSVMSENFNSITPPAIPSGWIKSGTNNNWWTYDFSGNKVLYADLATPYTNNIDTAVTSPTYNLGGNNTSATISFYTQCDTEYYTPETSDYMALEVSSDGTNFTTLAYWNETTLDSLNGDSNPSGSAGYYIDGLSLPSQYLTSNFKFRFKWHTDSSNVPVQNYDGCFVDDLKITKFSDGSDNQYQYMDGTSMAAPHVAGLAALIEGYNSKLTSSQVKSIILTTGDIKASLSGTVSGKRINAYNALLAAAPTNPATVNLGTAGNYAILAKTKITTTGATSITGDIGISPPAASYLEGFSPSLDSSGTFSTSTYVTGKIYAADYHEPTPTALTSTVSAMEAAYTDASGRTPDELNRLGGTLPLGTTFTRGIYKWGTNVNITGDITLSGSATDVWIFIIAGNLDISASKKVLLSGGAQAKNVFWVVAGTTTIEPGATTTFEGNILGGPGTSTIAMQSGAILHGRTLGQTDVTLIANTITAPDSRSAKAITAFTIPNQVGLTTINESAKTIAVIMPYGTVVTALVPTFTITGSSVAVGATPQVSGTTPNNFTSPVTYTVTSADTTEQEYIVTVTVAVPSTIATVTSATYTVSSGGTASETIPNVPFGTPKADFLAALSKGQVNQTWNDAGINNPVVTGNTLVVTAQDGSTVVTYTVTVNKETTPPTILLFSPTDNATNVSVDVQPTLTFSEEIDTSTMNGENIELREYATLSADATKVPALLTYSAGNKVTFVLSSPLKYNKQYYFWVGTGVKDIAGNSFAADTWYHSQRDNHEFTTEAVPLSSIAITHSANKLSYTVGDALDITGLEITGTYSDTTTKIETITANNVSGFNSSAPATGQVLTITVGGKTATYTINIVAPLSSAKNITSFSFAEGAGVITGTNIAVTVPFGTVVTGLIPTITVSTGASVSPNSGVEQDFTSPVTYTVTAENSSSQAYVVTVSFSTNPDIALVATDKDALVDGSIKGANTDLSNITGALTNPLPSTGTNGSTITWVSSNTDVVSNNGQTVVRPAFTASDVTVTLTATLTRGVATDTKTFTLIVLKLPASTVATISSESYIVSAGVTSAETITNVPFGISKTTFLSALTKGESNQIWDEAGVTNPVVTGNILVVTAQDGVTTVTYTIITSDDPDIALVTSDRGALVDNSIKGENTDLSNITVVLATLPAVGSVNSSTITWASSNELVVSNDGQTINRPAFADGNTTVALTATLTKGAVTQTKAFTLIVLKLPASAVATVTSGTYIVNDTDSTITGIPYGTSSSAFLAGLTKGESHQTWNPSDLSDPVLTGDTFVITAQDGSTTKTYTLTVDLNSIKRITAFSFPEGAGVINETNHTISVNVPFGTDVTLLTSTISITSGAVINVHNAVQDFTNPVTYTITAEDGSTQVYTVTVKVLADTQIAPVTANDGSGDVTINSTTPEVVITNPTQSVDITISSGTTNPTIDVSSFISGGTGTLPAINITSANANNVNVAIPASTIVTSADNTWDGVIAAPIVTTVTLPETSGQTKTLSTAIEVGFTGAELTFNNAVRLLLPGQAGKRAGYTRTGISFTEITGTCSADNQATGDALVAGGECKIDVGSDLVIWTKHFTSFATYTQTTNNTGGGGGGGGGGGSSNPPPSGKKGDANGDSKVDKYDFSLMMANWGENGTNTSDFNGDSKVDKYDFALLMSNWGL